jgi:hypothetical protein
MKWPQEVRVRAIENGQLSAAVATIKEKRRFVWQADRAQERFGIACHQATEVEPKGHAGSLAMTT